MKRNVVHYEALRDSGSAFSVTNSRYLYIYYWWEEVLFRSLGE